MAVDFNDTQKRYDRLINLVVEELKKLFSNLLTDKENHKRLRNTVAHKIHTDRTKYIANKRAEMETKAQAATFNNGSTYRVPTSLLEQLDGLQIQLEHLIVEEIQIERREAILIKDDPVRIDKEITIIKDIISYLKNKARSKGKIRGLTRESAAAIHDKLKDVYDSFFSNSSTFSFSLYTYSFSSSKIRPIPRFF